MMGAAQPVEAVEPYPADANDEAGDAGFVPPIPAPSAEPFSSLVVLQPGGVEAEAIRGLRTRIMAQHVREGRRSLAICSPSAETGCTFVASNLAVALAQIGVKTVLVDADLRQPGVAAMFGIADDNPGLSDYLADPSLRLDDVVYGDAMPHLSLVTAGLPPHNPQELLSSHRFRALVDQLLREYDLTILDTTPTNACTDAQRVATVAGYSLIVARKHKSFMGDVATLAKLLRADRSMVVGTVLNDF